MVILMGKCPIEAKCPYRVEGVKRIDQLQLIYQYHNYTWHKKNE